MESDAAKPSLALLMRSKQRRVHTSLEPTQSLPESRTETSPRSSSLASLLAGRRPTVSPQNSLASKLMALKTERKVANGSKAELHTTPVDEREEKPVIVHEEKTDPWSSFQKLRESQGQGNASLHTHFQPPQLRITNIIVSSEPSAGIQISEGKLKRKYDEIFGVFYPNNNSQAAKKQAISNFNKPSPDDVVLTAQKKAFTDVEKVASEVSKLSVNGGSDQDIDIESEESDDDRKPKAEPVIKTYKKITTPTKPRNPVDIQSYVSSRKPHLNFVVLGHVDAGKSTLMGRLLYDVGAVNYKLIRKLKKESEQAGKGSFHLAWVMDQTSEERDRGVTVDICTSDFETDRATFTIIDAPGHRDFVPNAITGISQADAAVLTIDCCVDAFESGFSLDGQTKEHTLLARSLGARHIVVAMNKMDHEGWYPTRFFDIKWELESFFKDIGIKKEQVSWVTCSGLSGEGVYNIKRPLGIDWYNDPSLVDCLEDVAKKLNKDESSEAIEANFLFSILDVSPTSKNNEVIVSGKVEAGSIQPGETITIYPSEQSVLVDSILSGNDRASVKIAVAGDFVMLKLREAYYEDIQSGDLATTVGNDIPTAQEFTAQLLTFKLDRPLLPGTSFMLFRGGCEQPARIKKLVSIVCKKDPKKILKKKVKHLGSDQAAIVEIELIEKKRRIPILTIEKSKHLGRIVLRKEGRTVAAGLVESLDF